MADTSRLKPEFNVYLDGTRLDGEAKGAISGIRVHLTHDGASAFELVVDDPDLKWQGKPTFTECKEVKIELGVPGRMKRVFDGEVTAWRTELERSGPTVMVLRGMDRSHRLMRGHKTKTYANASPIDCARQIASAAGLAAKTAAGQPAPVKTFRLQANESDFSFLRKMADLEGYLFYVDGTDLHFERPTLSSSDDVTVTFGEDVKAFLPVANFRRPASEVEVGAWDSAAKAPLTGKAGSGDELWSVPGGKPGVALAKFQGTKPKLGIVESQVATQEHADTVAKAALTKRNLEFLTAEVEVQGNPQIKPGAMVNIRKVGVYSGHYLVTEANHFFDGAGYNCIFYVARDKWGDSSSAQQQQQAATQQQKAATQAAQQAAQPQSRNVFAVEVVDDATGDPLPGVRLEVALADGSKRRIETGRAGSAELRGIGPGQNGLGSPLPGAVLDRTLAFVSISPASGGASGQATSHPPPPGNCIIAKVDEYKVKTGDTFAQIAANNGLTERELATFNWGLSGPADIERRLREEVGCTKKTKTGRYRFDDSDEPGIIYVPKAWSESGLASGQRHAVRVRRVVRRLPDIKFWYQIDTDAPQAKNDTLTLEAEDGSWRHEIAVSSLSEVEPDWVELVFPRPPAGVRFNLIQDPGDGEPAFYVFKGASYGDLRDSIAEQTGRDDGTA